MRRQLDAVTGQLAQPGGQVRARQRGFRIRRIDDIPHAQRIALAAERHRRGRGGIERALRDRRLGGFLFRDPIRAAGVQQDQAEQQGQDQTCFVS